MADELADNLKAAIGNPLSTTSLPVQTIERSDPATPIEIENAGSSVTQYLWGFSYSTLAALGVDATDGAPVVRQHNIVSGADGTKGITLPELLVQNYDTPILVYNDDATNTLKVWGNTTGTDDTINGATNFLVPPKCLAIFYSLAASAWYGGVVAFCSTLSAYTQTYSTAHRTVADATVAAVATDAAGLAAYGYTEAQANAIPVAINALAADVLQLKKNLTALIDDLQAQKIVA